MFAKSDNVQLAYIKETVLGTTPTTPAFQRLRKTGESLGYAVTTKASEEITGDGNVTDLIPVAASTNGGITFEMSYGAYDDLFASVMGAGWDTNVLKNGQDVMPLTLEKRFYHGLSAADAARYSYFRYMGMVGNTMEIKISANDVITGSFDFLGMKSASAEAIIEGATYTDPPTEEILSASDHVGTLSFGSFSNANLLSVTLNVNHNAMGAGKIGSRDFADISYGEFTLTGTIEVYFDEMSMYDAYVNAESLSLSLTLGKLANRKYKFEMPKIKLSDCKIVAGSKNQYAVASMPFQGLFDATEACTFKITKGVA